MALTGLTLASNLRYIHPVRPDLWPDDCRFQWKGRLQLLKHATIPDPGLIGNIILVLTIFIVGIITGGTTALATYLALGIAGGWLVLSVVYLIVTSARKGQAIIPSTASMALKE